jgi:PAS domain S-box-containing protein
MPQKQLFREQLLHRFLNLKISKQKELQDIVALAAEICRTGHALLTLTEETTPYINFSAGVKIKTESLENYSLLFEDIIDDDVVVIPDLINDYRFGGNPLINIHPPIRFYAGLPIISYDGQRYGSLCVFGHETKDLTEQQKKMLRVLSQQIINVLEFDTSLNILKSQFYEIQNSENIFRSFFESSRSSHVLVDHNMNILAFNRAFTELTFRLNGTEVKTGNSVLQYLHKSLEKDFKKNFQVALAGGVVEHEWLLQFEDAPQMWSKIVYNPAVDGEGNIIGISFKAVDVTERKISQEKILKQNESLRKIAHFQSHELRKPVASILGLMNVIKLEGGGDGDQNFKMMERAVLDLDNTIRSISSTIETQPEQKLL